MEKGAFHATRRSLRPLQFFLLVLFGVLSISFSQQASAYQFSAFLDDGGPVEDAVDIRISLWGIAEVRSGDINGSGNINTSALHYGDYQIEVESITPGEGNGLVQISSFVLAGFPNEALDFSNYLGQLEWKYENAANTTYQIYDFSSDSPFFDKQRIPVTDEGDVSYIAVDSGPRSNSDSFTLDANNNASGNISLVFGETLAETLAFDTSAGRFQFSDDLNVVGLLTVNGVAVDITKDTDSLYINRQSSSASYTTLGEFIYSGTNVEGAISAMNAVMSIGSGATSYSARIYDVTNAQVIAEVTGLTNTTPGMQSFGTVSNLPSGQALLQLQVKRVGGLLQIITVSTWQLIH